jgi:hypothetical protein
MLPALAARYGGDGKEVEFAESFHLAGYGRSADAAEIAQLLAPGKSR